MLTVGSMYTWTPCPKPSHGSQPYVFGQELHANFIELSLSLPSTVENSLLGQPRAGKKVAVH